MITSLVTLLHLCDSLFPIGAFAHSDGLESATSTGAVANRADLRLWLEAALRETLRHLEGPGVARAWKTVEPCAVDDLLAIDAELYALRPSSTGRESTRAMGGRLLKTWHQLYPHELLASMVDKRSPLTLPAAFGVVCAVSDIPLPSAVEGYFYTRLAAMVSAAMRLMPLGQGEAHALLAGMLREVPAVAADAIADDQPLRSFTPLVDLMAMRQQYVESRLFRS